MALKVQGPGVGTKPTKPELGCARARPPPALMLTVRFYSLTRCRGLSQWLFRSIINSPH